MVAENSCSTTEFAGPSRFLPVVAILSGLVPLIASVRTNINWDEFKFLSHIYELQQSRLDSAFQTGYVHFFSWLPHVGRYEVDQIISARLCFFVLLLVSAFCLYRVAQTFVSRSASWVVLIALFLFSNVMVHGVSFRSDGLALCAYMLCLALLLSDRRTGRTVLLAGAVFGLAVFVTVKSVLLGLSLLPVLLLTADTTGRDLVGRIRDPVTFCITASATGGLLYLLHIGALAGVADPTVGVLAAGEKTIFSAGFLPRPVSLVVTLWLNPTTWMLLVGGLGILLLRISRGYDRRRSLQILSLLLPLLSIFFYRNAFSYFYVLILPPALVLVGVAFDALAQATRRWRPIVLVIPLLIVVDAIPVLEFRTRDTLTRQREIIEAVHRMFPQPVPYIDGASMIASFPKVGFFMSGWGMENYLARGTPVFRDLIRTERPHFLVANASELEIFDHIYESEGASGLELLPADRHVLRSQFVHHWGPVYVPGTEVRLSGDSLVSWEALIPGTYTVESDSVIINGTLQGPGSLVRLESGAHEILGIGDDTHAVIRWGDHLYRPDYPPPETPIFIGL